MSSFGDASAPPAPASAEYHAEYHNVESNVDEHQPDGVDGPQPATVILPREGERSKWEERIMIGVLVGVSVCVGMIFYGMVLGPGPNDNTLALGQTQSQPGLQQVEGSPLYSNGDKVFLPVRMLTPEEQQQEAERQKALENCNKCCRCYERYYLGCWISKCCFEGGCCGEQQKADYNAWNQAYIDFWEKDVPGGFCLENFVTPCICPPWLWPCCRKLGCAVVPIGI